MGSPLGDQDPAVFEAILAEQARQEGGLELIASENYTSQAVMQAVGSVLTNKYAEGLPGKRYYGGCEFADAVEHIARERAIRLFGQGDLKLGVNVQPHSGATANGAVFLALLKPGDTLMGLALDNGGHLTHGAPVAASGLLYDAVPYHVNPVTGLIDMDEVRQLARQRLPKVIVAGASAYPRTIDFEAFGSIANEIGASLVSDIAHIAGLVVTGLHPHPLPHSRFVTGTTHKTLRGPRGGFIVGRAGDDMVLMNKAVFPGTIGGPLMHVIAGKAVGFGENLRPEFKLYMQQVLANAKAMADTFCELGVHLATGGTDNHLMLVDLGRSSGVEIKAGKEAEAVLGLAGITVNRNTVPGETRTALDPSGIRIGTPAITTRGATVEDCQLFARLIVRVLVSPTDEIVASVRGEVEEWCKQHPVYPEYAALLAEARGEESVGDSEVVTPHGETIPGA